MQASAWKSLLTGAAVWAAVVVAVPARAAQAAPTPEDATAVSVTVDCLAPFAHLRSLAAGADILAQADAAAAPELRSSSSCVRRGKGALAYCEGSCEYTHLTCREVVTGTGFICQCK